MCLLLNFLSKGNNYIVMSKLSSLNNMNNKNNVRLNGRMIFSFRTKEKPFIMTTDRL